MSAATAISFAADIKPLFREAMMGFFDLWNHADVVENAAAIAERLRYGSMPCDGDWPDDQLDLFERWVETGMPG